MSAAHFRFAASSAEKDAADASSAVSCSAAAAMRPAVCCSLAAVAADNVALAARPVRGAEKGRERSGAKAAHSSTQQHAAAAAGSIQQYQHQHQHQHQLQLQQ